jgi:hypothetical protein
MRHSSWESGPESQSSSVALKGVECRVQSHSDQQQDEVRYVRPSCPLGRPRPRSDPPCRRNSGDSRVSAVKCTSSLPIR